MLQIDIARKVIPRHLPEQRMHDGNSREHERVLKATKAAAMVRLANAGENWQSSGWSMAGMGRLEK